MRHLHHASLLVDIIATDTFQVSRKNNPTTYHILDIQLILLIQFHSHKLQVAHDEYPALYIAFVAWDLLRTDQRDDGVLCLVNHDHEVGGRDGHVWVVLSATTTTKQRIRNPTVLIFQTIFNTF